MHDILGSWEHGTSIWQKRLSSMKLVRKTDEAMNPELYTTFIKESQRLTVHLQHQGITQLLTTNLNGSTHHLLHSCNIQSVVLVILCVSFDVLRSAVYVSPHAITSIFYHLSLCDVTQFQQIIK